MIGVLVNILKNTVFAKEEEASILIIPLIEILDFCMIPI